MAQANRRKTPTPAQAPDQSVDYRRHGHAGDVHGGARLLHRQCRAAAYRRHARRQLRREHVGDYQLSGIERDRAADERMALKCDWPQALLHDVRRHLHDQLVSLRTGAEPADADSSFASCRARAAAGCSPASRRSWRIRFPPSSAAWRLRCMEWRWWLRPRSARRWAAGLRTTTAGTGSSSSTCRSASFR